MSHSIVEHHLPEEIITLMKYNITCREKQQRCYIILAMYVCCLVTVTELIVRGDASGPSWFTSTGDNDWLITLYFRFAVINQSDMTQCQQQRKPSEFLQSSSVTTRMGMCEEKLTVKVEERKRHCWSAGCPLLSNVLPSVAGETVMILPWQL